jgi:hypothetical protein
MEVRQLLRPAIAGVLFLTLAGGAPAPQRDPTALLALKTIEQGQWQLKEADGGGTRNVCLGNPATLLQIRHGSAQCSHFVVENSKQVATIHYTCPGHGYGRTTVSVETPRLVRVDTQGVADGAPFADVMEGRRTGACN